MGSNLRRVLATAVFPIAQGLIVLALLGCSQPFRADDTNPIETLLRISVKAEQVKAAARARQRAGEDPSPQIRALVEFKALMDAGRSQQAEAVLDRALAGTAAESVPTTSPMPIPAPSPTPGPEPIPKPTRPGKWVHASQTPMLDRAHPPAGLPAELRKPGLVMLWNDPSVLKQRDGYAMWAAMSPDGHPRSSAIYELRSNDGVRWELENAGKPVFSKGVKGKDPDFYAVETPVVINVEGTYHLYYSFYKNGKVPYLSMGHATSPDGIHWKRLGELIELTHPVGEPKGNLWGWLARGEPAVAHVDGTFYLYFTDVRCRQKNCKGRAVAQRGISLATSADGHHFTQHGSQPILLQTARYPASDGWEGYSTPWVYHTGNTFELYVDLFRRIGDESNQTTISHYRSSDGVRFEEVETDIVQSDGHPWAKMSVRAPSVIEDGGALKLWYAGDGLVPGKHGAGDIVNGRVQIGIGSVSRRR